VEQKKKAKDDKAMAEEDKRMMTIRLDERTHDVQTMTVNQVDMANQLLGASKKLSPLFGQKVEVFSLIFKLSVN
jgi:hypothetical protein